MINIKGQLMMIYYDSYGSNVCVTFRTFLERHLQTKQLICCNGKFATKNLVCSKSFAFLYNIKY